MSDTSTILSLPLIQASQAQKHVTHNEAIRRLDALVQPVVQDMDRTEPPALPNDGARHIVANGASGEWLNQDGTIAVREGNAWTFIASADGWRTHVTALAADVVRLNGVWSTPPVQGDMVGVNTAADTTNRLAVSADATLLTHDGAGHQLKLNKASAGETASLLFQTDWGGRAEMGTSGDDAFAIKSSADGSIWNTALSVDPGTGLARFPSGLRAPRSTSIDGRWTCGAPGEWITFNPAFGTAGGNFDQSCGSGAQPTLDWTHMGPVLAEGTTLADVVLGLRRVSGDITGFDIRVAYQYGPWGEGWLSDATTTRDTVFSADNVAMTGGWMQHVSSGTPYVTPQDGHLLIFLRWRGWTSGSRRICSTIRVNTIS